MRKDYKKFNCDQVVSTIVRHTKETVAQRIVRELKSITIGLDEFREMREDITKRIGEPMFNEIENTYLDLDRGLWKL